MSPEPKKTSFKSLLAQARNRQPEEGSEVQEQKLEESSERDSKASVPVHEKSEEPKKPGRPRGRRSDPNYTQISAYVPLDLYIDIQTELLKEKKSKRQRSATDVSGLVEQLLREWLKQRQDE